VGEQPQLDGIDQLTAVNTAGRGGATRVDVLDGRDQRGKSFINDI